MTTLDQKAREAAIAAVRSTLWERNAATVADTAITAYLDALSSLPEQAVTEVEAERDMAERAAAEAAIPLEALMMAGQGYLSDAVWDAARNGVGHVRSMLSARAARTRRLSGDGVQAGRADDPREALRKRLETMHGIALRNWFGMGRFDGLPDAELRKTIIAFFYPRAINGGKNG